MKTVPPNPPLENVHCAKAAGGIASLREGPERKHLISTGDQIDTHASWSRRE